MEFSTQAMVIDYGCWRLSVILQYENEVLCLFDEWEEWEAASVKKKRKKKRKMIVGENQAKTCFSPLRVKIYQ